MCVNKINYCIITIQNVYCLLMTSLYIISWYYMYKYFKQFQTHKTEIAYELTDKHW